MQASRAKLNRTVGAGRARPDLRILPVTIQGQTVAKLRDAILTGVFRPGLRPLLPEAHARHRSPVPLPS
jgi:hypothetical protein